MQRNLFLLTLLPMSVMTASGQQTFEQWLQEDQQAFTQYQAEVTAQYNQFLKEEAQAYDVFVKEAGKQWGEKNIWMPDLKRWVQYTESLEERSAVQFEDGVAEVEVIIDPGMSEAEVKTLIANGVENLVLSGTLDPIEMIRRRLFPKSVQETKDPDPGSTLPSARRTVSMASPVRHETARPAGPFPVPSAAQTGRYTVQSGDTLWGLAKRFNLSRQLIAEANGISPDGWLKVGQKLIIPGQPAGASSAPGENNAIVLNRQTTPPPQIAEVSTPPSTAALHKQPLLDRQVAMPDGTPVTRENVRAFAEAQADSAAVQRKTVTGSDNVTRDVVAVSFPLVPDHLRVRAERFRPAISKYAALHGVYPPLIYAIIHSESSFNPRARSSAPAYGLMQLVPKSAGRDAYLFVYKEDRMLSDTYLYDPDRNIELGSAYLHILDQRYFKKIENPTNRMLCSIAAYNTGAGNVCKAFGAGTSLTRAAPVINSMTPDQIYSQLRSNLPYEETRNYIVKVNDRLALYRDWK